jgi:hypothetical protein
MAVSTMTPADVKATCDKLECSPQSKFSDSNYGGQASIAVGGSAQAGGSESTGDFGNGKGVPGYGSKHAKKAPQF